MALASREVLALLPRHDYTLPGLLATRAAARPDHDALVCDGRTWSWRALERDVGRVAGWFAAQGVTRGGRVAVVASNSAAFVLAYFALGRLGATLATINPDVSAPDVADLLARVAPRLVLHGGAGSARTSEALALHPLHAVALDDMLLEAEAGAFEAPPAAARPEDNCLVMFTSGTTGRAKGVMHSQRTFALAGECFVERMRLQPDDRLLAVLPLFHINAMFYSVGGACAAGATVIVAPRFSASTFWQLAAETRATEVNLIMAATSILIRRPRSEFVPHAIRKTYAAPVTREIGETLARDFGITTVIEGFGMTEIPGAISQPFDGPPVWGAMGRPSRHPDGQVIAAVRIVDDALRDLPDGSPGEMLVKTPIVMQGYFDDPEQTAASFDGEWFRTGDLVRRDADGMLWFEARLKDIIRRRGENIAGAELDRVVGAHPDVQECAAIPVPAELGEDDILIAIVPRLGHAINAAAFAAWCRERLPRIKVPRYLAVVEALPHNATHKVEKFRLRADAGLRARAVDLDLL
jgi:crotonobetaine/carnitine-CoA ligase